MYEVTRDLVQMVPPRSFNNTNQRARSTNSVSNHPGLHGYLALFDRKKAPPGGVFLSEWGEEEEI